MFKLIELQQRECFFQVLGKVLSLFLFFFTPSPVAQEKHKDSQYWIHILGYLKNTHKNLKFGKVRQVPAREFPTKFPGWDLLEFGFFGGIL